MKIGQISSSISNMATSSNTSDFNQWLHAMKMVARLPGGMPPEFRRKLWLALAERHLQNNAIEWEKEQEKCMCEQNRDDDEELEIQIVKDLHRTGSSLFSGPAGSLNQAKLKRVLLGYARWNPEVGYCQGFNMLGALILQVMDKNDIESLKVMIFLIEGILPTGYFSGSLGGLQADMAVFREILAARLPRLAKHLQKLQGPMGEGSFEPPLTNVFTMQWFLTLFCTCLPINCVLRVWDLVLIEGSDVLLRTALAIWGLLEERILSTKTADDFYCKMGMLSGELLNGHLFDSNGLIQKVVDLGPISELQKMRDKHLYNITPWRDKRGLRLFFTDEEGDSDDDSRLAVTTAWGIRLGRRGSMGMPATSNRPVPDSRDRIALDISLLKKQYDKLRERQRQAHIILTTTARQTVDSTNASSMQVNQYLMGRNAIVSQKGRRIGPPPGAIPPVRKIAALKSAKSSPKPHKRGETLLWKDIDSAQSKRIKEIAVDNKSELIEQPVMMLEDRNFNITKSPSVTSSISSASDVSVPTSSRSRKKSESSSYSDESDGGNSSTSTSLCDDENQEFSVSSIEASPLRKRTSTTTTTTNRLNNDSIINTSQITDCIKNLNEMNTFADDILPMDVNLPPESKNERSTEKLVDKVVEQLENTTLRLELNTDSGIANDDEIMFLKISEETTVTGFDDSVVADSSENVIECDSRSEIDSRTELESIRNYIFINQHQNIVKATDECSEHAARIAEVDNEPKLGRDLSPQKDTTNFILTRLPIISHSSQSITAPGVLPSQTILKSTLSPIAITSTSQLSPIADISKYLSSSSISPLKTPSSFLDYSDMTTVNTAAEAISSVTANSGTEAFNFKVNDEGVTNEYFERITAPERPSRLELRSSISESIKTKSSQNEELPSISGRIVSPKHTYVVISSPPIIQPTDPPESDKVTMRYSHPCGSSSSASFMKEKSLSLDEPIMKKHEFRPTSCPEAITENFIQKKSADRVLKIIEENSKILHRILKKTTCNDDVGTFIEPCQLPSLSEHFTDSIAAVTTMISEQEALDFEKPQQIRQPTFIRQQTIEDGDISVTLSSIQNTIKSVDSLCQYDESRTKTVELLASIEKLNESSKDYYDNATATTDPEVSMPANLLTINVQQDDDATSDARKIVAAAERSPDSKLSLYASRYSRDSRRDVSPRRKRDDDREEYESRFRRDGSMTKSDILPQKRYSDFIELDSGIGSSLNRTSITHEDDFTSTYQGQYKRSYETIERPKVSDSVLYKSYESNLNSNTLNDVAYKSTGYGDKFEIRHTTVTSTFYDRFLSQKKERTVKLDKSPSSPVITKAYLDSLRLPIVLDRNSKSAENSPSRPGTMTTITKPVVVSAPSIREYRSADSPITSRDTIFSPANIT